MITQAGFCGGKCRNVGRNNSRVISEVFEANEDKDGPAKIETHFKAHPETENVDLKGVNSIGKKAKYEAANVLSECRGTGSGFGA